MADSRVLASLRRRMAQCYALRELELDMPAAARGLRIALPADPDAPLDALAIQTEGGKGRAVAPASDGDNAAVAARRAVAAGAHMPYWGLLWPSGIALAEALVAAGDTLRGRRALELGCGLGVAAAAGLRAGLDLWAADTFAEALLFTRHNALRNAGRAPRTLLVDWHTEAGRAACLRTGPFDLLLAADVLYEQSDLAPLLDLAPRLLKPGAPFWLAEPGRRVSRAFVAAARERDWCDTETSIERAWPPDGDVVCVALHRFTGLRV